LSFEYAGKAWSFRGWEYLTPDGIRDYLPLGAEGKRVLDVWASIDESKNANRIRAGRARYRRILTQCN